MPVSIALPAASDSPDSVLCHQLRDVIAVALRTFDMSERKEQFALTTSEGKRIQEGTPKLAHWRDYIAFSDDPKPFPVLGHELACATRVVSGTNESYRPGVQGLPR
jgi:hypothetical protein